MSSLIAGMQGLMCPVCAHPQPQLIESASREAVVIYYRCPDCHHVWGISRSDPAMIHHVTAVPDITKH